MRVGIRRKLIGTLMLVGLLPLAMSLVVILGGGAAIRLSQIRGSYEDTAATCAEHISDALLHEEYEKLSLLTELPETVAYVRSQNKRLATAGPDGELAIPTSTPEDDELDRQWAGIKETDPVLAGIRNNEVAKRLTLLSSMDGHPRQTMVTNAAGQLIAADGRTDDYFQADEGWWQTAFDHGRGQLYISSITPTIMGGGAARMKPGDQVVEIAIPIYDIIDGKRAVIGILKDELGVKWLLRTLHDIPAAKRFDALIQLIDVRDTKTIYAVYAMGDTLASLAGADTTKAQQYYFGHKDELDRQTPARVHTMSLLYNDLVIGSDAVRLNSRLPGQISQAKVPQWVVVVSQPAGVALTPVYHLAGVVAAVGIVLILVLFILGVAISNREIIMPILRLREATAAVGRGELNVRLLSKDAKGTAGGEDRTFRHDELGELARDFDEMTRELQKNVNQLARSNEAKRRFMELAGHELRTPVAYLLGVCQLAQKQLAQLSMASAESAGDNERSVALAARNAASVSGALAKIANKTQRLSRIIDNLLKLVNNDQFTTRMNKQPVDMRALILQVAADHRPFILERKQQLIVDVAENLPPLEADRDKLEDALTNLVSNAIRFSPDGSVVRIAAHEVVGDMIEILVEDSGPGIPAVDLANLFEPFYTGDDILHHHSGTFEYGSKGLGLGLAIVRRFIELHRGVVRAQAIVRDGKTTGTQFQILLPLINEDGTDPRAGSGSPVPQPRAQG